MDDQRNYPTDDAEKLCLLMLQLDEAAREAVFATIRELAAEGEKLEQATTVPTPISATRCMSTRCGKESTTAF